jgi:hypothetical protein
VTQAPVVCPEERQTLRHAELLHELPELRPLHRAHDVIDVDDDGLGPRRLHVLDDRRIEHPGDLGACVLQGGRYRTLELGRAGPAREDREAVAQ